VRRINEPVPALVLLGEDGYPTAVEWTPQRAGGARRRRDQVECVLDTWCVDEAWWTDQPVRRLYHELQLASGAHLVACWDLVAERWYVQR